MKKRKVFNKLVLLRHGQSLWNLENKFTGWTNIGLTKKGISEAEEAGNILSKNNFYFDQVFSSFLIRAKETMRLCLNQIDREPLDIYFSWRLNERHYGALQGLNKSDTAKKYGEKQVHMWRRSYDIAPPPLEENDKRHPMYDKLYKNVKTSKLPKSESLKDTIMRIKPLWKSKIQTKIKSGEKVLIVAHGNSLRAIIQILENHSDEEIMNINIPTGNPLIYALNSNLQTLEKNYLL